MYFSTPEHLTNNDISVTVVGCGGTGGYVLSLLAQMSYILSKISEGDVYLNVTAFDGDTVSQFNCGRQNYYPLDIGFNKAETLINRINMGFGTNWIAKNCHFNVEESGVGDILITCVDNIETRKKIGEKYKDSNCRTLWIDGGNGQFDGQVIIGHLGKLINSKALRLPNFYDLYHETFDSTVEDITESCSHEDSINKQSFGINQQTALLICNLLWRLLRHGGCNYQGSYFSLKDGECDPLLIDENVWSSFGYSPNAT